jgi:hypothetical protein
MRLTILGRKISEVPPEIKQSEFGRIGVYGDVAVHGEKKEFK